MPYVKNLEQDALKTLIYYIHGRQCNTHAFSFNNIKSKPLKFFFKPEKK